MLVTQPLSVENALLLKSAENWKSLDLFPGRETPETSFLPDAKFLDASGRELRDLLAATQDKSRSTEHPKDQCKGSRFGDFLNPNN